MPTIWQIAPPVGVANAVSEFFLRHGVALLWDGDRGPWRPDRHLGYHEADWMRSFAEGVSDGDAILLRTAPTRIRAIGLVASQYSYEDRFDDVHGLDFQHCRRVRWLKLPEEHDFGSSVFTRGRFSSVRNTLVREYVRRILESPPTQWQGALLRELPPEEPTLEEVPEFLRGFVAEANDLVPLYLNEEGFGKEPLEAEIVTHLVVPFLRALGWSPERIAVEWRDIDLTLFRELPRRAEKCHLLIEVKRIGGGVEEALKQARGYVAALGLPRDVVVTDGIRYRMYACQNDFRPIAYANLARLKRSASDLFSLMKKP